jgi:hypothetical protein
MKDAVAEGVQLPFPVRDLEDVERSSYKQATRVRLLHPAPIAIQG